jgi:hypothetical protein
MTTRFYLLDTTTGGAAPVSPAFAAWNSTGSALRRRLSTILEPYSVFESIGVAEAVTTNPYDVLLAQFVSAPLDVNQTITGTVKGQIRASEANLDADFRTQLVLKVVSGDGVTLRGTLLTFDVSALSSEFATALTNRKVPLAASSPATLSSVAALAGDRIVAEIGYRSHNTHSTSRTGTVEIGCASATDLAEDETTTTQNNPWIEFSQSLTFAVVNRRVSGSMIEAAGRKAQSDVRVSGSMIEAAGSKAQAEVRVSGFMLEVAATEFDYGWGIALDGE